MAVPERNNTDSLAALGVTETGLDKVVVQYAEASKDPEAIEGIQLLHEWGLLSDDAADREIVREVQRRYLEFQAERASLYDIDYRTGLLDGRAFQREISKMAASRFRYGREFGVLILDLDEFKAVNTQLGIQRGNEILTQAGAVLMDIRKDDMAFRYGNGDEFAILTPDSDLDHLTDYKHVLEEHFGEIETGLGPLEFTAGFAVSEHFSPDFSETELVARMVHLADRTIQDKKRLKRQAKQREAKGLSVGDA